MNTVRHPLAAALAGLSTAIFASVSVAQESNPPVAELEDLEELGALEDVEAAPLEMTVEDALLFALGNNIGYKLSEIDTEISRFNELGSWGAFDWVFDASTTYQDAEREVAGDPSAGQPAVRSDDTNVTGTLDLTKPLTTGGSFNLNFAATDSDRSSVFQGGSLDSGETNSFLRLSYVQPLRRGAWRDYATSEQREAEIDYQKQVEAQRQSRQDLLFDVHNAYWELVSAIEQRGVAESFLELGREQVEQEQRRLDVGMGVQVDVLQAEVEVASRFETLIEMQNLVHQEMDDLKAMIFGGTEADLWELRILPVTPLPAEVSSDGVPPWSEALWVALEERSELRQQRLEVDAARERHARTLSERLAGVDLTLAANSGNTDTDEANAIADTFAYEFPTYSATIAYNMPIGNRTADNAERSARARVRSALLQYDNLEIGVVADVRNAVREVIYQAEAVSAAVRSLELADEQLRSQEARQDAGLATTFEVLEFQQDLAEAQSTERRARVDFAKALVSLRNAQGLLGEDDDL